MTQSNASTKTTKNKKPQEKEEEQFKIRHVFAAFASLPRVLGLVWSTDKPLTLGMGLLSVVRGFIPAISVYITKEVIDSVVNAIRTTPHVTTMVWVFVGLQLVVNLLNQLFSTLSNIVQQLLQEKVSNRVQLLVLEKANTLDLSFFENAEFYDKLRRASEEANYKPVNMVSQTFDLARSIITLISMLGLLVQLAWWLALVALVMPLPSFVASTRYGWRGYQMMRRQSPERRKMW